MVTSHYKQVPLQYDQLMTHFCLVHFQNHGGFKDGVKLPESFYFLTEIPLK